MLYHNLENPELRKLFADDGSVEYAANGGGVEDNGYVVFADGGIGYIHAVQENLDTVDFNDPDDRQWFVVGAVVHWEGDPLYCDISDREIESVYGPVED